MTGHGSDTGQRPARNSDRPGRPEGRGRPDGPRHDGPRHDGRRPDRSGPSGKTDAADHENEEAEVEEILEPPYTAPLLQGSGVKGGEVFSARAAAIHLLTLWEQSSSAPMESLLSEYLEYTGLADSDRRFLVELCYGSVRMRGTVRHLSNHFMDRDFTEAERTLRSAIAIGIYQRVYLKTAAHAAVSATVDAWREVARFLPEVIGDPPERRNPKAESGYINAVLRSACDGLEHVTEELDDPTDAVRAASGWVRVRDLRLPGGNKGKILRRGIQYSHPPELLRRWLERYPEERVLEMLQRNNEAPPLFIALKSSREPEHQLRMMATIDQEARIARGAPRTLEVLGGGRIERIPGFTQGDFWVQDLTARRLALRMPKGEDIHFLDLCSAPGGKLATLLDRGGIRKALACDVSQEKLQLIRENLDRLNLLNLHQTEFREVSRDPANLRFDETFDQILVDAPCSNSGVLNRRQDARWRFRPDEISELEQLQSGLLKSAIRHLRRGGHLLYSTCSVEPQENQDVIRRVLEQNTEIRLVEEIEVLPGDLGGDGGYAALLQRVDR
ncbi:MAG: RsmB/NOP family class I SAM-dependent RNA methyltransferase [Planctomycetota bacterium]